MNAGALEGTISQEQQLTEQLLQVLEQEQAALIDDDTDALQKITPEKARLINAFVMARQQLRHDLAELGLATGEAGVHQWLKNQLNALSEQNRQAFLALQSRAQHINLTNGLLIQKLSARNQAALNVLLGPRASGLYGPDGQHRRSTPFGAVV